MVGTARHVYMSLVFTATLRSMQEMPNSCIVCGHTKAKGKSVSMHRFPSDSAKRQKWLDALGMTEGNLTLQARICSCHFLNGDTSQVPSLKIGKRFASPRKLQTERGKRYISPVFVGAISDVELTRAWRRSLEISLIFRLWQIEGSPYKTNLAA